MKITIRNLARNLFFVIINIIALGLSLSIGIVAYLNHKYDADWDKMHIRAKEIYKVIFTREIQGRQQPYGATPIPVGNFIGQNISGVESVIRFHGTSSPVKVGLNNYSCSIGYADPGFMDLFTFQGQAAHPDRPDHGIHLFRRGGSDREDHVHFQRPG